MSKQQGQGPVIAHRWHYSGPEPLAGEVGFAQFPSRAAPGHFEVLTAEEVMNYPRHAQEDHEQESLLAALADGSTWMARRDAGVRCPGCGEEYRDVPTIEYVGDMVHTNMSWDGRVYELSRSERQHAEVFHWLAWWQHDPGCNLPVSYAVTEAQVLAWTDAYGPWRRRGEPQP